VTAFLTVAPTAHASETLCNQLDYLANKTGPMLANVPHAPLRPPPPDPGPNVVADPWSYGKSTYNFGGGYACTFRQLGTTALVHLECDLAPGAKGITGNVDACMAKFTNWHPFGEGAVNDQIYYNSFSQADLSETITTWTRPDGVLTFMDIVAHSP
jgi:hypothetical protein